MGKELSHSILDMINIDKMPKIGSMGCDAVKCKLEMKLELK
jgi:hypothetical protein